LTDSTGSGVMRPSRARRPRVRRTHASRVEPTLVCLGDLMLDVVVRASTPIERGTDVPGDVRFRLFGREYVLPFASTILLSLAALVIGKLL